MVQRISAENNFVYLTVALALLLLASAILDQTATDPGPSLEALTILVLGAGVWTVRTQRRWFHTGVGFIIAVLLIVVAGVILDMAGLRYLHLGIMLVFFSLSTWLAARQVLLSGPIDLNKIIGAICIFLLLGLSWTILYALIGELMPGAFSGLTAADWHENLHDLAYFSFVTLTTLGYGDITPALPVVRFLVYMEAIVGQFYIAIVVASLIGVRISDRPRSHA